MQQSWSSYGPRSAGYNPENELLTKRITTVEDFRREMHDRWYKSRKKRASRDIPVPLRSGETFGQYKKEFEKWLWTRKETMSWIQKDPVRERGFWFNFAYIRSGTVTHEAVGIGSKKRASQTEARSYYGPDPVETKRQRTDNDTTLLLRAENLETSSGKGEKNATALKSDSSRPKSREHANIPVPRSPPPLAATTPCHLEVGKAGNMPSPNTESEAPPMNESALVQSMAHAVECSSKIEVEKDACMMAPDIELRWKELMGATPSSSTPAPTKLCKLADTALPSMTQGAKASSRMEEEKERGTPSTSPESDASPNNACVSRRSTDHNVEIQQQIDEVKGEEEHAMSPGVGMGMEDLRASNAHKATNASTNDEKKKRKEENSTLTSGGPTFLPPQQREYEFYVPISREEYLAQRVLTPEEYLKEIMELKHKQTPGVPDERLPKIPVPLAPGETIAFFEQSFLSWVSKRNQSQESLYMDPTKERGLRFQFALEKAFLVVPTFDIRTQKPHPVGRREGSSSNTVPERVPREPFCAPLFSPSEIIACGNEANHTSIQNSAALSHTSNASTTRKPVNTSAASRNVVFESTDKLCSATTTEGIPGWAAKLVGRVQELEAKVEKLELEIDSYRADARIQGSSSDYNLSANSIKTCAEEAMAGDLRQPPRLSPTISTQKTDALVVKGSSSASNGDTSGEQAKIDEGETANDEQAPATISKRNKRGITQVEERARLMEMYTTSSADILRDGVIGLTEAVQSRVKENHRNQKLTKAYTQLNDQIILNETAISDAAAYMKTIKNADEAVTMEQHNQIMELVVSVNKEKEKRSAALATVIVEHWAGKNHELSILVDEKPAEDTTRGPTHEKLAVLLVRMDTSKSKLDEQETELGRCLQVVYAIPPTVRGIPRALRFSALQKMTAQIRRELAMKGKLEADFENLLTRFVARDDQVRRSVAELLNGTRRN